MTIARSVEHPTPPPDRIETAPLSETSMMQSVLNEFSICRDAWQRGEASPGHNLREIKSQYMELRNRLNILEGYLDLLEESERLDSQVQQVFQEAVSALLTNMTFFSSLEAFFAYDKQQNNYDVVKTQIPTFLELYQTPPALVLMIV